MKKKPLFLIVLGGIALCVTVFGVVNYFSIDRNAQRVEEGNFILQGEKYIAVSIRFTEEGKPIAKADGFDIMEIPEDQDHNFLAVRSGLDNWTIAKESYKIPTSGKLNVAYCNHARITDGNQWSMIQSISEEDFQGSFTIRTDSEMDIHNATMSIYVGYQSCPVGTDWIGSIGNINGQLVFIPSKDLKNGDLQYTCYILNDEYQELYESSLHLTFETVS